MQTQQIFVFLAHALVLVGLHAQESIDASCERYAARIGVFASCDAREFVEPVAPVTDIGLEAALVQRVESSALTDQASTETVPRPEDPVASDNG